MVTVLHSSRRRSRKDRQCDSCNRTIAKGEQYLSQDCVYDDTRYGWSACEHCRLALSWVYREHDPGWFDGGIDLGEFLSDLRRESLSIFRLDHYFRAKWRRSDGELVDPIHLGIIPQPSEREAGA
jgi:hypothetical protein